MPQPSYFLNGCTCSGKTTLAKALQSKCAYPLLHLSLDGWLAMQGEARWNRFPNKMDVWDRMLDGFHASISAVIDAGTAVVIDHLLQEKRWLPALAPALANRDCYLIGVHCPVEVAQKRIRARGSLDTETLPFQLPRVHRHGIYDLEVDTSQATPEELAERLLALPQSAEPTAFARIAAAADEILQPTKS